MGNKHGYANAAEWVYRHGMEPGSWAGDALVTLTEIRLVHALALGPVWDVAPHPEAGDEERPGSFRRHDTETFPGGMKPPSWTDVPTRLDEWLANARALFLDGNGRTGRLLLNLLLVRLGYPPAAAVRGRLEAVKGRDGAWRSSRESVDEYVASRYKREPVAG